MKDKEPILSVELDEAANDYADKHGFRVPYDGSNKFYDDNDVKWSKEGFLAGALSDAAKNHWQPKQQQGAIEKSELKKVLMYAVDDMRVKGMGACSVINHWVSAWMEENKELIDKLLQSKQQQVAELDEELFNKIEEDFGFLGIIKMACESNGIGNNYFKKRDELKEKYKAALQKQIK